MLSEKLLLAAAYSAGDKTGCTGCCNKDDGYTVVNETTGTQKVKTFNAFVDRFATQEDKDNVIVTRGCEIARFALTPRRARQPSKSRYVDAAADTSIGDLHPVVCMYVSVSSYWVLHLESMPCPDH